MAKKKIIKITLDEYLSKHNRQRNLDKVIKKWYLKKDKMNSVREKVEWDKIIHKFHTEKE